MSFWSTWKNKSTQNILTLSYEKIATLENSVAQGLFYLEFTTAKSRGCFMRKCSFTGDTIEAI